MLAVAWTGTAFAGSVSVDAARKSVLVVTGLNAVRVQPWLAGSLRVEAAPGTVIPSKKSLTVTAAPDASGWTVKEEPDRVVIHGSRMSASVDKKSGEISFFDAKGAQLLAQTGWSFALAKNPERDGLQPGMTFSKAADERFYGGGVVGEDLRQPTASIDFSNSNTRIRVPVIYSSHGYGILWDNAGRSRLELKPEVASWTSSSGDLADFYVMAGPSADQVIGEYRQLTGAAPLLPKWAYGFWFSRNKFSRQQEIEDAAKEFRARKFPVDLLIQDYYFWKSGEGGLNWGSHEFDAARYPDPKGMIDQLHRDHLQFMAVIWAKFHPDTAHYKELEAAGVLFSAHGDWAGPMVRYYNPFNPKGQEIYGKQVMESLLTLGMDGFWMDGAEPEMDLNKFAAFESGSEPISRVMNAFPLVHTESIYKAQRSVSDSKRVVLLPRSAWAGFQRNSACNWTGDIKQNWLTLAWQIEGLQNFSITGIPYITTDIGGYEPDAVSESDRELFVRWFQWGAFCPIFRVHGIARPFPWQYGTEAEAILKKFDTLRYRLLPYIYTQAAAITHQNGTLMRPLVMDFQDDAKALGTWDEFMFGPAFLVCPVYQSSREQVKTSLDQWADRDGSPNGVTATHLTPGAETEGRVELREENPGRETRLKGRSLGFRVTPPAEEQKKAAKVRIEGLFTPKEDGTVELEFASDRYPDHLVLDGQSATADVPRDRMQFPEYPLHCKAGVPIRFSFESAEKQPAFRIVRLPAGTPKREVYLPGKGDWYDFWTGKRFSGGQTLKVPVPMETMPLYVRAGSIVPMGPEVQYANEKLVEPVELRVYPGADGRFTLYEDEGESYRYEKGAFATIPLEWNEAGQTLTIGLRKGDFPGMASQRTFKVVLVRENSEGEAKTVAYDGTPVSVKW